MSDSLFTSPAPVIRLSDYSARPFRPQTPAVDPDQAKLASILALNAVLLQRIGALQRALDRQRGERAAVVVRPVFEPADNQPAVPSVASAEMPRIAGLTPKQMQVLTRLLAGQPNKIIAADLGISRRTVENHRAAIMQRSGATSLPALARMAVGRSADGDSH